MHEAIRGFDWSQEVRGLVAAFAGKLALSICILGHEHVCRD